MLCPTLLKTKWKPAPTSRLGSSLLPLLLFFWLLIIGCSSAQERPLRILAWNVENLFDTINHPQTLDDDFLPQGRYHWTSQRYRHKLFQIARTLTAIDLLAPPDLIVLCEVESDTVLTHLTHRTGLAHLHYDYIMTHSRDPRGINVALLYQPYRFRLLQHTSYRVADFPTLSPTRDLLHATGRLVSGDTLDIFCIHAPSRRSHSSIAERRRKAVNTLLRAKADSVLHKRTHPYVIIMGDFNDEATDPSIRDGLHPLPPKPPYLPRELYLLSGHFNHKGVRGTYKFRGHWNTLDQCIVNGALLLPESPWTTTPELCRPLTFPFLLTSDSNNGVKPKRCYLGTFYQGGISDHLPLLLEVQRHAPSPHAAPSSPSPLHNDR